MIENRAHKVLGEVDIEQQNTPLFIDPYMSGKLAHMDWRSEILLEKDTKRKPSCHISFHLGDLHHHERTEAIIASTTIALSAVTAGVVSGEIYKYYINNLNGFFSNLLSN